MQDFFHQQYLAENKHVITFKQIQPCQQDGAPTHLHIEVIYPPPISGWKTPSFHAFGTASLQGPHNSPLITEGGWLHYPPLSVTQSRFESHSHRIRYELRTTPSYFLHYTGCLIGILILVYDNPYKTGYYNPLYTLTNRVFSLLIC